MNVPYQIIKSDRKTIAIRRFYFKCLSYQYLYRKIAVYSSQIQHAEGKKKNQPQMKKKPAPNTIKSFETEKSPEFLGIQDFL